VTEDAVDHVHLIFKTHLDLGFTDFARAVLNHYLTDFIPHALNLARHLRETESPVRFVWTTGSWLIDTYLEESDASARKGMEAAILAGDITWHALPFTTHSELMDADLFRFGLSLSQGLDARFGRKTIAAKMTDVPGHTRGIVPLLAEAGVEFLHIGVNEASPLPEVPPLFVWLDRASGESVVVNYHASYGEETLLPSLGSALVIASTGDNAGPHDEASVMRRFHQLQGRFPGARIAASTLDAFAVELRAIRHTLPVVTSEIGDTWIHGAGTDPEKVRKFRALSRLGLSGTGLFEASYRAFRKQLLCVPEHTWGLDVKTHLHDYEHYDAKSFLQARHLPNFQAMEESWAEQRQYLDQAVDALQGTTMHADAVAILQSEPRPESDGGTPTQDRTFETPHFEIAFDPQTGAINHLRHMNRLWATADHPLGLFRYETFSQADYDVFWKQFIRNADREDVHAWAIYDYTKPGIAGAAETNRLIPARLVDLRRVEDPTGTRFNLILEPPARLSTRYGAPKQVRLDVHCLHDQPRINMTLSWEAKPACRLPEAAWVSFLPLTALDGGWELAKLGSQIDPRDVVSRGNRSLHAVDGEIRYRDSVAQLLLTTADAPLVAPGEPGLLRFTDRLPEVGGGMHINLFNNVWATNFPQWIEGPGLFRFALDFASRVR